MLLLELKIARLADNKENKELFPESRASGWQWGRIISLCIKSHFISSSYAALAAGHLCLLGSC